MGKTLRRLAVLALVLSLSCVLFPVYGQGEIEEVVSGEPAEPIEELEGIDVGGDEMLEEAELTAEEIAESVETEKALEAQMGAETAKREADAALASGDYDLAVARLKEAVRLVPDDEEALEHLREVQKAYVYDLLKAEKYDEALIQADDFLARFTDSSDRDVMEVESFRATAAELSHAGPIDTQTEQEQVAGTPLLDQLDDTQLLAEAIRAYRKKDYEIAEDLLLSAREIEPYNIEVTRWLDRVKYQKYLHKRSFREAIRKDMLEQVQNAWIDRPRAPRVEVGPIGPPEPEPVSKAREVILRKLETIIPKVDFEEAELKEVIRFLSREADVNIVIDPVVLQAGGVTTTPGPLEPYPEEGGFLGEEPITIPSEEPGLGEFAPQGSIGPAARAAAASPGGTAPRGPAYPEEMPGGRLSPERFRTGPTTAPSIGTGVYAPPQQSTISLHLTNVPLKDVLKYVLRFKNLKYVVEDFAILIIPIDYVLPEDLETEIFRLSTSGVGTSAAAQPGFTEGEDGGFGSFGGSAYGDSGFGEDGGAGVGQPQTIKEWLQNAAGVTWPDHSDIVYHQPTATLIVTNTPTNMVLIRELIRIWDRPPMQVEVEARFAHIEMHHGFENAFRLGMTDALRWTRNEGRNLGTMPLASRERIELLSNPGTLIGTISDDAFSDLGDLTGTGSDALLRISGILTRPEFSLVWYALDKTTTTELLSAPRVTTVSGQQALISVREEIRYPTEYETESIEEVVAYEAQLTGAQLFFATPSTFETRNVGILLSVTPTVSSDGEVITLVLLPEVSKLIRWINYGSQMIPLNQPVFQARTVTTTVYINDGETLVLGGIIQGDTTTVEDRVPVLGSIPLLGRLFRGSYEIDKKVNLMIFVSADLITSRGTRIKRERQLTEQRARYLARYQRELEAAEAEGQSITTGGSR